MLVNNTHIKVNEARARDIDPNTFDREPEKELLGRNTRQLADPAETQCARDVKIVVELVLELSVARMLQEDLKMAGRRVVGEFGDALWEEAYGKAVEPEVVIDCGWVA